MSKEEIIAHLGDSLRQATPKEIAEWQVTQLRARDLGVELLSQRGIRLSLFGKMFGPPF